MENVKRQFIYIDGGQHVIYSTSTRCVGDSYLFPRGSDYKPDFAFKDLDDGRITVLSSCRIILKRDEDEALEMKLKLDACKNVEERDRVMIAYDKVKQPPSAFFCLKRLWVRLYVLNIFYQCKRW